jgi:hypothetical protein
VTPTPFTPFPSRLSVVLDGDLGVIANSLQVQHFQIEKTLKKTGDGILYSWLYHKM